VDDATSQSRKVWDALAPGWSRLRDSLNAREAPTTERMFTALGVRPGDTILEVCAGPGEVGLQLAEQHPDVAVIVTDFASAMVDAAREEGERRGITNARFDVVDAQAIDLPDASVDGVLSRFGLMLVPDAPRAFREIRRVLRPGRSLVYTTWAPLDANPWMAIFGAVMVQRGHFTPPEGGAFMPLATTDDNVAAANAAGFAGVEAEYLDLPQRFDMFEDYWEVQRELAGPLALILKTLPQDEVDAVRSQVEEYAQPFRSGDGFEFPSRRILVHAR
jgi:ubiquinone/menaquinone biosynthesis C-methylase UbiE